MSDAPLPCPFCGATPGRTSNGFDASTWPVVCRSDGCPIRGLVIFLESWAIRAPSPVPVAVSLEVVGEDRYRNNALAHSMARAQMPLADAVVTLLDLLTETQAHVVKLAKLQPVFYPASGLGDGAGWVPLPCEKEPPRTALYYFPAGKKDGSQYAATICGRYEYHGPFQPTHWHPLPHPPIPSPPAAGGVM